MFIEIRCYDCLKIIDSSQLNLDEKTAICNHCGYQFGFGSNWDSRLRKKRESFLPEGFQLLKTESSIEIKWDIMSVFSNNPLFKGIASVSAFFNYIFYSIIFVFISIWIYGFIKQEFARNQNSIQIITTIIGVSSALLMLYFVGRSFRPSKKEHKLELTKTDFVLKNYIHENSNKTDKAAIFRMNCTDIKQVYVESAEEMPSAFEIVILSQEGTQFRPFYLFTQLDQALFFEQEIENFLGIKDEITPNEFLP